MISNIFQDLTFAGRMLRKSPGFTVACLLTLGVGIGVNVAIFSIVHAVLLSELPYPEPDRLVAILENAEGSTSFLNYLDWKSGQHSFEDVAVSRRDDFNLTGVGDPERFSGLFVTASYFRVLNVPMILGRGFFDEDDSVAGANPIVLSEHLWRSRFAADRSIVGRKITVNAISYEVVGVAPENLSTMSNPETARNLKGASNADLYAPFGFYVNRPYMRERGRRAGFRGIARLKDGVSLTRAGADMKVLARNLEVKFPEANTGLFLSVIPLKDSIVGKYQAMLWLLEGAGALVLLITCANIANLLLVRTAARQREIAVRATLGATRTRLIWQLLTESIVLAILGGTLGCILAFWSKNLIIALAPSDLPRLQEIRLDLTVLAFSLLITLGATVLFGLGPARSLSNTELNVLSKSVGGSRPHQILGVLIVGQVAFACVLLTAAALLTQTLRALQGVPIGFNPNHLLVVGIKLPAQRYPENKKGGFYQELIQKVESLPLVKAAALDDDVPFGGVRGTEDFAITGQPEPRHGEEPIAEVHGVSPGYFRTMGISILQGRSFSNEDVVGRPLVIIVDESLARKFFPGRDAIGQQLNEQLEPGEPKTHFMIVGIVSSVRHGEERVEPSIPTIYWPAAQFSALSTNLLVRTEGDPMALLSSIRTVVHSVDSELPIFEARTMNEAIAASIGTQRLSATLIGGFSFLALFLAALGLHGVLAYSVAQRTREIGIRMALGSTRTQILRLVVRKGMLFVALGSCLGIALSLVVGPLFQHFLYGVPPNDILSIGGTALLLGVTALVACYLPARRAAQVQPIEALRTE